jgi:hypothetical protein
MITVLVGSYSVVIQTEYTKLGYELGKLKTEEAALTERKSLLTSELSSLMSKKTLLTLSQIKHE